MIRLGRSFTPLSFKQPKLEKKKEEETKTEEKKPEANTSEQTGTKSGNSNKTLADFLNNNNMLPISYKPFNPDGISKADFENITDDPKALDPLTGSLISLDEWNKKYDNGNQMLEVIIPTNVGNGTARIDYEYMTASEYIQKYGNSTNPPKASIWTN